MCHTIILTMHSIFRMTQLSSHVSNEIRAVAARKNIRSGAIAQALGCSPATASRKLNGHAPITVDELHKIANALDVDPADLIGRRSA